ncbi:phage integrase Arm DNA-binding domain-containing protein [Pseudomonas sp. FP1742]|uniref:phage integrase Arm DNA-binding domain-containing protein n=1 Tax=Pseudomonas sp. FP1742 TaxID=2954079 RepID=UPI002736D880|nr:phage integrase Arm DNA-binding domain-containing protein [Pseudomonas sp. FP1742]WLG53835.1 phage integrase Arm DNA-binding domain-containing protein [Pseudomonas sp. FP1742]
MVPRPRNKANKNLPQNLYFDSRRSSYRYRRPTDGKWFQFGTDRIKAIDAAKQLNLEFMRGADLIGAVMGNASESFAGFLDTYERDVLPPRELAKVYLYVVQQKTTKASDAAWIRFKVTEELQAVISRCRDDIASPYLVHRRPDRLKQKQAQTKDHWTQIEERYLTRAFKEARELAGCYKGWKEEEMPGFHEVRALSLHLYKKAGKDGQKIAGHASEGMTKNYQRDHEEVIWSEAIPDLNISEITG